VQDNVEDPEPATLVGVRVHAVLLDARLTVPVKPWRAVMVIVELPADPAFTVTLVGLAAMVKSWIVKVTVVLWDNVPLVPVTVT
jgi:hypothetical protein